MKSGKDVTTHEHIASALSAVPVRNSMVHTLHTDTEVIVALNKLAKSVSAGFASTSTVRLARYADDGSITVYHYAGYGKGVFIPAEHCSRLLAPLQQAPFGTVVPGTSTLTKVRWDGDDKPKKLRRSIVWHDPTRAQSEAEDVEDTDLQLPYRVHKGERTLFECVRCHHVCISERDINAHKCKAGAVINTAVEMGKRAAADRADGEVVEVLDVTEVAALTATQMAASKVRRLPAGWARRAARNAANKWTTQVSQRLTALFNNGFKLGCKKLSGAEAAAVLKAEGIPEEDIPTAKAVKAFFSRLSSAVKSTQRTAATAGGDINGAGGAGVAASGVGGGDGDRDSDGDSDDGGVVGAGAGAPVPRRVPPKKRTADGPQAAVAEEMWGITAIHRHEKINHRWYLTITWEDGSRGPNDFYLTAQDSRDAVLEYIESLADVKERNMLMKELRKADEEAK